MSAPRAGASVSVLAVCGLGVPLAAALALSLFSIVGWVRGSDPFWNAQDLNLSEAAMVRDAAEMARLIRGGIDPGKAWLVRDALIDSGRAETLTPLEAAIRNRRSELVELLLREGLRLDGPTRAAMAAQALAAGASDIVDILDHLTVAVP